MSSLYEGYKEALRRGHVATLRERHEAAIVAYREASRLAPDRALPYVGLAGALARVGRTDEAFGAYRAALDRAPDDEGALRGYGELLETKGRRAEAATTYDRLAGVLDRAGRLAAACDTARRALELAESRGRRRLVQDLVARLRDNAEDDAAAQALERALSVLEVDRVSPAGAAAPEPAANAPEAIEAIDDVEPRAAGATPEVSTSGDPTPEASAPEVPTAPIAPPPDPVALRLAFEAAIASGNLDDARRQAVATSLAHRTLGQFHAAIDACYEALAIAPADPGIHFALAQAYLERGWRSLAADKLVLIGRLAQLTGDSASLARLCDLATRRFPDDPRLTAMCA